MIKITLDIKEFNFEKLDEALRTISTFDGLIESDNLVAILFDEATQQDIEAVNSIVATHNTTKTDKQISNDARLQLRSDSDYSKVSWKIIQDFYKPLDDYILNFISNGGTVQSLNRSTVLTTVYTQWRSLFLALPSVWQLRLAVYIYMQSSLFTIVPEPIPVTDAYRAWFTQSLDNALQHLATIASA